jgi:hypothetical protein
VEAVAEAMSDPDRPTLQGPQGLVGEAIEVWEHAGLRCAIVPHPHLGMFNGYVRLPEGHPGREGTYDDIDVEVHCGLTFGPDDDGWVGFDTGHAGDYWAPDDLIGILDEASLRHFGAGGIAGHMRTQLRRFGPDPMERQWTIGALRAEVERLAEQLAGNPLATPGPKP